jgi:hypothetical protein
VKSGLLRWTIACLVFGAPTALLARDQTNHANIRGAESCSTIDALGTGDGVLQAGVELSHIGGPAAANLGFTFLFPNGSAATATARRLDSATGNFGGKQRVRYALTAVVINPAGPNPKELVVNWDDQNFPNFLSGGALVRIKLDSQPRSCTPSQLQ